MSHAARPPASAQPEKGSSRGAALFVVFEGIDGSGTTTQCDLLCRRLRCEGHDIVQSREPGGTPGGERIRELVLDPSLVDLDDVAELLLIAASRRQHVVELIEPSLAAGKPVITDRYALSSHAYQGAGRGLDEALVRSVNAMATDGREADVTVILDLAPADADGRRRARDRQHDRIEAVGGSFQSRVRDAYLKLGQQDTRRFVVLDASPPSQELAERIHRELVDRFPRFPYSSA